MTRGVIIFDHRNKIIDFNSAFKKYFQDPSGIRLGNSAEEIFQDRPEIIELLNTQSQDTIESKINGNGEELVQKIEAIPISDSKTLVSGMMLLFDDISVEIKINEQLKKQAAELQQLNDLKDKFFSIISHDLKGPVFGVKELIYLTQNGLISEEEFMGMLPEVSRNLEHVAILLENLLTWTSSQLRGEFVQPQTLDLTKLAVSQKTLLERIAKEKSIGITLEGFDNTFVNADKNMLELILRNLISNAIKFSNPGTKVEVSCTCLLYTSDAADE